jgi:hypothetical protein
MSVRRGTAPSFQEVGKEFINFLKDDCKIRSSIQNVHELAVNVGDEWRPRQ